jgi:type I restriction enzyme S subunit
MTFSNGINAPKENYGTGTKMISVMDILNPLPIKYDNILNSVAVDKKIEDKNKVEKGDLIFVRSSEIVEEVGWAKAYKEDRYALYSGFAIRGKRISSYNAYFIELTLNYANRKEVERRAGGSTRFNISQEILNSLTVLTPSISEQNQIDLFFTKIDNTITLHQRKLDKLKLVKQFYLQQMFPQNGEKVPRVRFANFDENWEQRKIGELLTERNEQIPENEEYPLMSFVQEIGVIPKGERYDRSFLVKDNNKKYKKTELGDFIYSSNNLETGSIGFNRTGKAVISPVYSIFESKTEHESKFIGVLSVKKDFINKMLHYRQGVVYGQWRIHENDFLNIQIFVPNKNEQEKIVEFFNLVNHSIEIQQSKLEKLKKIKHTFLQKMFI